MGTKDKVQFVQTRLPRLLKLPSKTSYQNSLLKLLSKTPFAKLDIKTPQQNSKAKLPCETPMQVYDFKTSLRWWWGGGVFPSVKSSKKSALYFSEINKNEAP